MVFKLLDPIYNDADFRINLGEKFYEECATDTEPVDFKRIATQYEENESQRELIDDIFISICGWSFETLIFKTLEDYEGN